MTRDGTTSIVRWQDMEVVTLASSFAGIDEKEYVQRWSESVKKFVMVDQAQCVCNFTTAIREKLIILIARYHCIELKQTQENVRLAQSSILQICC